MELYNAQALLLSHPGKMIRDTARYPPLMRPSAPGRKPKPKALRQLAFEVLGLGIQEGEHSPVEDARAALFLYQRHAKVTCWPDWLSQLTGLQAWHLWHSFRVTVVLNECAASLLILLLLNQEWERNIQKGTVSKLLPQGKVGGRRGTGAVKTLAAFAATDVMVDL